jgi:hypothetical protein
MVVVLLDPVAPVGRVQTYDTAFSIAGTIYTAADCP